MSPNQLSKPIEGNLTPEKKNIPASPETLLVEQKPAPERAETIIEADRERIRQEILKEIQESEKPKKRFPLQKPAEPLVPVVLPKSETLVKIEKILEEDLQDAYFKMEPKVQEKFKTEGEKTAAKIEKIMQQTKIKAKDIFKLIFQWLKIIPGVNKFFIKQEAKIKTDKIIKIK
ncbi:MAG: hypothetical protein WCW26_01500 [Candidatus Buchananbacteria bacterium]